MHTAHKFRLMTDLDRMLISLLGSTTLVDQWWKSQNLAFGLLTPEEMFDKDPMRVFGYVESFCYK